MKNYGETMRRVEELRTEIEAERRKMDEMLEKSSMEEALEQSRKVDRLIEKYLILTENTPDMVVV